LDFDRNSSIHISSMLNSYPLPTIFFLNLTFWYLLFYWSSYFHPPVGTKMKINVI